MTDDSKDKERNSGVVLTAAHPVPEELRRGTPSYMPRIPWTMLLGFFGFIGLSYFGYQYRLHLQREELRAQIVTTHETRLNTLARRYREFRSTVEEFVVIAHRDAQNAQSADALRQVDPRLRVSGLHNSPGVYLRIPFAQADSAEHIGASALAMGGDAIRGCLGIAPMSLRGLYEAGEFLMPSWPESVRHETDLMKLRVREYELTHRSAVDVPVISTMLEARYFMLVLEHGETRREEPVDVFLWDIPTRTRLLAARIVASGVLLPVRLRFEGVHPEVPSASPNVFSPGAFDCSIAAEIKALTGEPALSVGSDLGTALLEPTTDAAVDAGVVGGDS